MIKQIMMLLLIVSVVFLCSCSLGGSRTEILNSSNDDEQAVARLEQVIKATKNKDKKALKSVFSKQTLEQADDFDNCMDDLFDFFQGEVNSWKKSSGPTVFESNDHGHKNKKVSSYYYVNTDKQKYFFLLEYCPVDTDYPNNIGIYLLLVVKAEDREKIYDGDQKILYDGNKDIPRTGIYMPIK
jgi:hypothetical protein